MDPGRDLTSDPSSSQDRPPDVPGVRGLLPTLLVGLQLFVAEFNDGPAR
jgi:hypothetical protein